MRRRSVLLGISVVVASAAVVTPIVLMPGGRPGPGIAVPALDSSEHARTIEALRPPKRERPVIAILVLNEATEVTDLMVPYGVLAHANVADVTVVAEREAPVPLHPFSALGMGPALMSVEPQATTRAFDERHPDGADYVIVPAVMPRDDSFVTSWIVAQHRKGAKILSVCAGSLTLAAAGLLDGRRATTHWAYVDELQKAHPTVQRVADRRYVVDNGVGSSTGISATIPVTVALVEAIAGRSKAAQLAQTLSVRNWDARHRSSAFQLTWEHRKTFVRNWLSFWRRATLGVPIAEGVDEVALALTVDAYSRTALSKVVTVGSDDGAVRSKHGLTIHPTASRQSAAVDDMLPAPPSEAPATTLDRELARIASRFDRPTADIVALALEYPWVADAETTAGLWRGP